MAAVAFVAAWLAWAPAHLLALVHGAADSACNESGYDFADGRAVLQVIRNRADGDRHGWKRYDGTLMTALWAKDQHAHGCPIPLHPEHLLMGLQFATGTLPVPPWAYRAWFYEGNYDKPGACEARGGREIVGWIRHKFWSR